MSLIARICYLGLGLSLLSSPVASAISTVNLASGAKVVGDILKEKGDVVVVDLGFDVLTIPREEIVDIVNEDGSSISQQEKDLFFELESANILPVREHVERIGQAVVLIRTNTGLGSGFVVHPDGYVITNDHVVAGEYDISVTFYEKEEGNLRKDIYNNVRIVASSPEFDLALLKLEPEKEGDTLPHFEAVPLAASGHLKQGETVFALGSPLGLERSVSQGIVALKDRLIGGSIYIQQTAEISPGNSGGPLLNLKGEVVGVNNMKVVAAGAEGLNFAIPAEKVKTFIRHRDAYAFDPKNPNAGFRYNSPPTELSSDQD